MGYSDWISLVSGESLTMVANGDADVPSMELDVPLALPQLA